ncbi:MULTISPECIES: GntR family transcriptional regulator [Paracoccaceae]|jgi:DNA-binding GntR family transcriptional regulator|uniref:GntR family transcriptional regulator n=1 Tax=Paracoccaceae TaxID=31989 RepID=UPI003024A412
MTLADNAKANLSEKIYLDLRLRLIVGDLAPGTALSIRTLAEEANVSAMPVREALKRLENEKALTGSAKRAYRVPAVTPDVASDLFFLRATLEGAAAELAMGRLTKADLKQLRDFSRAMDAAWENGDARTFLLNNFRFHSLIYWSCGNQDLSELAEILYARSGPWLGKAIRELADKSDWANEHHDIIDAFDAGDKVRVRRLIESDVNWGTALFRSI